MSWLTDSLEGPLTEEAKPLSPVSPLRRLTEEDEKRRKAREKEKRVPQPPPSPSGAWLAESLAKPIARPSNEPSMAKTVALETLRGVGSDLSEILKAAKRGVVSTAENLLVHAPRAAAEITESLPGWMSGFDDPEYKARFDRDRERFERHIAAPAEEAFQAMGRLYEARPEVEDGGFLQQLRKNPGRALAVGLAENAPQFIATLGAAAAHPALGLAVAGGAEAGSAWREAKESGASDQDAAMAAGLTAAPNMILEYLPAGALLKRFAKGVPQPEVAGVVRGLLSQALKEGSTETVQEMNAVLAGVATYAGDQGLSWNDLRSLLGPENLERYGTAGVLGSLLGGASAAALTPGSHGKPEESASPPPPAPDPGPVAGAPPPAPPVPPPVARPVEPDPPPGRVLPFPPSPEPRGGGSESPGGNEPPAPLPTSPPAADPQPGPPTPRPAPPSPPQEPPPAPVFVLGRRDRAFTDRGREVEFDYALIEAGAALTSHDDALNPVPSYPQELQPRDRDRAASALQIASIEQGLNPALVGESAKAADGAPFLGPDGIVEGGNARTIGIRRAYRSGQESAGAYRSWLVENASRFGLSPEAIASMEHPLLVRVRRTEVSDRAELGRELNESGVARMSVTESARADAQRITPEMLDRLSIPESGEVNWAANREFVEGFIATLAPSEQGSLVDRHGRLSLEGQQRVRNAVLAKAYDDAETVARLVEDRDSNVRTVGAGVMREAPRLARLRSDMERGALYPRDLGPEIAAAVHKLSSLRAEGARVDDYLAQGEIFQAELSPEARELLSVFDRFGRSGRAVGDVLGTYAGLVESLGSPQQQPLFGPIEEPPGKLDLLRMAVSEVEQGRQRKLFGQPASAAGGVLADFDPEAQLSRTRSRGPSPGLFQEEDLSSQEIDEEMGESSQQGPSRSVDTEAARLPLEVPEIVELLQDLGQGRLPKVKKVLLGKLGVRGFFRLRPDLPGGGEVQIQAATAEDLKGAAFTLAHEAGHWVDALPDGVLKRGNILGHLAALHRYLRSMIDELPTDPSRIFSKAERSALRKEALQQARAEVGRRDPKALHQRMSEIYRLRLEQEMASRGLVDRNTIHEELRRVSTSWRGPFKPGDPYRDSPVELFADGFGALLNEPALLKRDAPTFHSLFFNYLDRRPEVQRIYEAIQQRIGQGTEAVQENRWQRYRKAVARGDQARAEALTRPETAATLSQSLLDGLLDRNVELYRRVERARRRGAALDPRQNPVFWAEEMAYHASEAAWYLDRLKTDVLEVTRGAGVADTDLGALLALHRAGHERAAMFNPLGVQGPFAQDLEAHGLAQLGPEKSTAVRQAAEAFWKLRKEVLSEIEDSGAYSEKFLSHAKDNPGYVKFFVTSHMSSDRFGKATGHLHRQLGTLQEIGNPVVETALTDLALLRVAHRTRAAKALASFHHQFFPEEIQVSRRGPGGRLVETNRKGHTTVLYLDQGTVRGFEVSDRVAAFLTEDLPTAGAAYAAYNLVTRPLRALLVDRNPWWAMWNLYKDAKTLAKQVVTGAAPGASRTRRLVSTVTSPVTSSLETFRYLLSALPDATKDVLLNDRSDTVRSMLKGRMLVETGDRPLSSAYAEDDLDGGAAMHALLRRFGVADAPRHGAGQRLLERLWDAAGKPGQLSERLVKIAGYKYLRANQKRLRLSDQEIGHRVRTLAGTPDVMRRGDWFRLTNSLFLFSNVSKEGFRSATQAARLNPAEYATKTLAFDVLPKLVLLGASAGFFGEALKDLLSKVSEYDKRNYLILPWGTTPSGKAVFTRIPRDHMGQLIGSAVWLAFSDASTQADLFDFLDQNLPYSPAALHPYLTAGLATTAYLRGKNPQDPYTGQPMIPERTFEAGGARSHLAFARALWNEVGGEVLVRFDTEEPEEAAGWIQKALRLPIAGPGLSRFLKISYQGTTERLRRINEEEKEHQAERSLDLEGIIRRGLEEDPEADLDRLYGDARDAGLDPGRRSDFRARVERMKVRLHGDAFDRAKAWAPSKKARERIDAERGEEASTE